MSSDQYEQIKMAPPVPRNMRAEMHESLLANAEWTVQHARSGVQVAEAELRKAQKRLEEAIDHREVTKAMLDADILKNGPVE